MGAIISYADRYCIVSLDAFERFRSLIMAMDRAFVSHLNKKRA